MEFKKLNLQQGDHILIHLNSGSSLDGAYSGNFNSDTCKFDFDNHSNGQQVTLSLEDLHSIIKKSIY